MDENNILEINESEFDNKVLEESLSRLVVVDFWAPWCGPCKQLTPLLEKTIAPNFNKIVLIKINIDDNQQIASQLRIQSIPAVFAFKDKKLVNAFQGVIPEKEIIKFLEKSLGGKLSDNYEDFYIQVDDLIKKGEINKSIVLLEEFISEHPQEIKGIVMYADCLIDFGDVNKAQEFVDSLSNEVVQKEEIKKIIKKIKLKKSSDQGPSLEELAKELEKKPNDLKIIFKIADTYFANNQYDATFDILLENFPKNKEKVKLKILNFFDVLGFEHDASIKYRKKFSSMMFS